MDYTYLHDDQLEQSILGEMLTNTKIARQGVDLLQEEDFYEGNSANRAVFSAMKILVDKNIVVDNNSIINQLTIMKQLDSIGGPNYLFTLVESVETSNNFEDHVKMLQDITLLRNTVKKCDSIVNFATKSKVVSISEFLTKTEDDINEITSKRRVSNFQRASDLANIVGSQLQNASGDEKITGLKTGFSQLDQALNGLGNGQMIVIAARPGVGKSALALNICFNIATNTHKSIAYFSLEMSNEELMRRIFALSSRVPQSKITTGFLNKEEKFLLYESQEKIANTNMFFEESTTTTIDDIMIKSRKLKENRKDLALIVIDHIGIIQEGAQKYSSDQEKISAFSRKLKSLALELNIPIIVVCHINRKADENESKIPQLSQLRGSGAIENDADRCLLLYRSKYYQNQGVDVKNKKGFGGQDGGMEVDIPDANRKDDNSGEMMNILIAKNRQGPTGKVDLLFFGSYGAFATPTGNVINDEDHFM